MRCTATAAQPTCMTVYLKLFVYRMLYDSPAPAGTLVLSASHKHHVMHPVALA